MHRLHRSLYVLCIFVAFVLTGCGSERTSSGVWREVTCDDSSEVVCHDTAYELHLGRYGRTLTGTVVRYRRQPGLDSLRRAYECGCFFIQGGRAIEDEFSFGLFEPDAQCEVTVDGVGRGQCRECECPLRRFRLVEEDGELVGVTTCVDGPSRPIRFELVSGRSRTQCRDINEP